METIEAREGKNGANPVQTCVLHKIEKTLCYFSLIVLALLPFAETIVRLVFRTGIPFSHGTLTHLLLLVGLFSGMLTTKAGEHLSIALAQNFLPTKIKNRVAVFTCLLSSFVLTVLTFTSISFVIIGLSPWRMIGFIPNQIYAIIIPVGYAVMALRFAKTAPVKGPLPVIVVILGMIFSSHMIVKVISHILWGFDVPDIVYDLTDFFSDMAYYVRAPAVIILILSALAGAPLFIVLGALSLLLIQSTGGEIDVVSNQIYTTLTRDSFIAIPLFTLTGFFLSESKAGARLVETFRCFFGWLPGGMVIATVTICAFFASFTGASGVTILALGGILFGILRQAKYSEKFSIGLLTSVGSIGLLFPPSIPMILVGTASMTNIFHVFLGGIIPGIILILSVVIFGIVVSVKSKIPIEPFNPKRAFSALKNSIFEILLPFLLIAGYFSGILSLVEIGAAAVIYVFIVEVFINKDLKLKDTITVFAKAVPIIGGVLSILALSQALSYYIVDTQAPMRLVDWMYETIESRVLFLLILNFSLLIIGCIMEIFSAILIVLPLILPLGEVYGIDPVHLGIIFITNMELGFATPPVGLNLFLAAYCFKKPFITVCRYVLPFLLINLVVVLLVTYVPWFSTFLVRVFG